VADITVYEGAKLPEIAIQFTDGSGDALAFGEQDTARLHLRSTDFENDLAMIIDGEAMTISTEDRPLGVARYFLTDQDVVDLIPEVGRSGFYYAVAEATVNDRKWREPRSGWLLVEIVPMLKADMRGSFPVA
jgi:hypothetical protein